MAKDFEGFEEKPKAELYIDLLGTTLKKYEIGRLEGDEVYMDSGSRNSPPSTTIEMKKTYLNGGQKERPLCSRKTRQRNCPKQLQNHNMPTYNFENSYCTNKGRDLRLVNKPPNAPWWIERMLQIIQRHRRTTLRWLAHPEREQNETEKSSNGMDWR